MNAVLIAVLVMLVLAALRVHVVLALFIGSVVGGLISGIGLDKTMVAFQTGLAGGAKIALSYALLGAFAIGCGQQRTAGTISTKNYGRRRQRK